MFRKYRHIHFVGVGGIGMSGIAEVLLTLGYKISGSDLKSSSVTARLKRHGAKIKYGHKASNVDGTHVVVTSSAVKPDNPEVLEAEKRGIPVVPRAEMLSELMRIKYGIAVAGTHGKTTTTSMVATILTRAGFDPTIVIGGKVNSFRTNARLGKGSFLVAEADESDRSFLKLSPTIAIVTNIDPEHMENYKSFQHVLDTYTSFINKVPFYGSVVGCNDHPEVKKVLKRCSRRIITYGLYTDSDFMAKNIEQVEGRLRFSVIRRGRTLGVVRIRIPGLHNVYNSLAAIAVSMELEIPFEVCASALEKFKGIERRFQVLRRGPGAMVVADYAHHPVEILATMKAARDGWPEKHLVVIHQPHRYTRLKSLFKDFVGVLGQADKVVLMPIYAASERPIRGISSKRLLAVLKVRYPNKEILYAENYPQVKKVLKRHVGNNDMLLFLGAGDIWGTAKVFAKDVGGWK